MALKPIVITTRSEQAAGSEYIWNKLQTPEVFISNIITQQVNVENSEELSKLISGIPTPLARAVMFKYAINYVGKVDQTLSGLMSFFKTIQDEWKGLIACIALDNQPITVEKITLDYSDGKKIELTKNLYEPKGALGNMLFDEKDLWCDQESLLDSAAKTSPAINVIRYNGIVIGATSPESLLFTAPAYSLNANKGFYSKITKKFIDPLKANLSGEDIEKLFVYVKHMNASLDLYIDQFKRLKPDVLRISAFLNNWISEIKTYATNKGYNIDENAIVPNFNKFPAPFDKIFNFQTTLYGYGGRISSKMEDFEGMAPIEVELAELLLNPDTCTICEIGFDNQNDDHEESSKAGVTMLKASSDAGDKYFTIPLSEKGLAIFQDDIENLIIIGGGLKSNLSAFYDMATKILQVTLQVDVNGNITSFTKKYKDSSKIGGEKIICWPDFVSKIWNKYYLYSELPHNSSELKAFPLRGDKNNFGLICQNKEGHFKLKKIAENGRKLEDEDTANILIEYNINKMGTADLKYEIYESEEPFKGIEFRRGTKQAGYLLFRSFNSNSANTLKDYRSLKYNLKPTRLGFDFGSNNICISYAEANGQPNLITFKNRRKFLLGIDVANNEKAAASAHEVFFFQNEETQSNQIKSMVMIHDERRVKEIEIAPIGELKKEIKGGFPVFEKNIPIDDSSETTYTTRFGGQPSYIKFNMKWSNDDTENAYKQSLLKSLYLKTYAELLDQAKYPEALVWAYPSSMNKSIIQKYSLLWLEVGKVNPLISYNNSSEFEYKKATVAQFGAGNNNNNNPNFPNLEPQTEAASVCKHALGVNFQTGERGLIIGFDTGGSTTDILCIASKKIKSVSGAIEIKNTLIKQSSIKFAAGKLADATRMSRKFQDVLKSFCLQRRFYIHGITIGPDKLNNNTASYYYNLIIDRLNSEEDLNEFYKNIAAYCPELYIINSFMTGLIMFYAGQLAHKIRLSQEANADDYQGTFDDVEIGCFGKGGRMFDWLKAMNQKAAATYYKECFNKGYGDNANEHILNFNIRPSNTNYVKSEVSFGLSRAEEIYVQKDQIGELIGEVGFKYDGVEVEDLASVETKFMRNFGNQFSTPREFKRFLEFTQIFYAFCHEYFEFTMPSITSDINNMRLIAYIGNIPEYMLARRSDEFDFEAPVIILEGMCFLDTILLPKLFGL